MSDHTEKVYKREHITIDWDQIRADRAKRLDAELARGVDNEDTRRHLADREGREYQAEAKKRPSRAKSGPSRRGSNLKAQGSGARREPVPQDVVDVIVRLYGVGNTAPGIAKQLSLHPNTVRDKLKERGVYDPERDQGGKGRTR